MDRWEIDLGTAHSKTPFFIKNWQYLKIGYCDGDCGISFEGTGMQDPNEIDTLREISRFTWLYIHNTAQPGCTLVIYFEEEGEKDLVRRVRRV